MGEVVVVTPSCVSATDLSDHGALILIASCAADRKVLLRP